jgi:hypothetical protein
MSERTYAREDHRDHLQGVADARDGYACSGLRNLRAPQRRQGTSVTDHALNDESWQSSGVARAGITLTLVAHGDTLGWGPAQEGRRDHP